MMLDYLSFPSPFMVAFFLITFGWLSTFCYRNQLLLSLLSLEFIILGLFMGMIFTLSTLGKPLSVAFYLLVLGACEASLGLSLLVSMTRVSGSDMLSNFTATKC